MGTLGKLAYQFYFKPFYQPVARFIHRGGLYGNFQNWRGEHDMIKTSSKLVLPKVESNSIYSVNFLTGINHWYQTIFCAYSLAKFSKEKIHFIFHDDGTWTPEFIERIKIQVPGCTLHTAEERRERVEKYLPRSKFPILRASSEKYPMFIKLIDSRVGINGWHLNLDSDILFYENPEFMLETMKNANQPLVMRDILCSFSYSFELLEDVLQMPIEGYINAGVAGFDNDKIDWEQLEHWGSKMALKEGINFFFEQTLTAMMVTGKEYRVLPEKDYIIIPSKNQIYKPEGVMHHYPSGNRFWYYRWGWKHVINK